MPIDDEADRESRAKLTRHWAKARARATTGATSSPRPISTYQTKTRKQVADRTQRAAGEALAALQLRQRKESQS